MGVQSVVTDGRSHQSEHGVLGGPEEGVKCCPECCDSRKWCVRLDHASSSLLLSSLELSDAQMYEPSIRAILGSAAHFCEAIVLKSRTRITKSPVPDKCCVRWHHAGATKKVDIRLPGERNSHSHSARPVYQIVSM